MKKDSIIILRVSSDFKKFLSEYIPKGSTMSEYIRMVLKNEINKKNRV